MQHGGAWDLFPSGFVEKQIDLQIQSGARPDAARRFARAVAFGGVTGAEAWDIVRERFCAHRGGNFQLLNIDELPDRTYRDAWRQGHNTGAVYVHMPAARRIQFERVKRAVERRNGSRLALGRRPIAPQWLTLGQAIRHARDEDELRRIWPDGIAAPVETRPSLHLDQRPQS